MRQRLRMLLTLWMWLAPLCASGCGGNDASEAELSRGGVPIVISVASVRPYRAQGIGGGPALSVTFKIAKSVLRNAAPAVRAGSLGYAVFEPRPDPQAPWQAVRLSLSPVWEPPRRIGVVVGWNTRYDDEAGVTGIISYGLYPTSERLAILERYPCRDLAAKVYVRKDGSATLARFIAPTTASAGPPCVTPEAAAEWGLR
jgi:hypothetical protein